MPYIAQEDRKALAGGAPPRNCGELNYLFTLEFLKDEPDNLQFNLRYIILQYLNGQSKLRYQHINDVSGALINAGVEYTRRTGKHPPAVISDVFVEMYDVIAVPYEDKKIVENGDIPGYFQPTDHPGDPQDQG